MQGYGIFITADVTYTFRGDLGGVCVCVCVCVCVLPLRSVAHSQLSLCVDNYVLRFHFH
jgi:hypothetical protein